MQVSKRIDRRRFIKSSALGAAGALALPFIPRTALADDKLLVVNSWGGAFTELEKKHVFGPFTAQTGIKIEVDTPVNFAKLKAQVESKNYLYDVSSLNAATMSQALNAGLLEPLDWDVVDKRGTKNTFFGDHGVGFSVLSTALCYRKDKFPNGGPKNWVDFFDVAKFPGPRSMGKRAYTTIAFALLGSGVPRENLFPFDMKRAFDTLARIRPSIKTWWELGNESEELLRRAEVNMMSIWNQRPVNLIKAGVPVEIVWDGAEHVPGYYYAAKGTPRKKAAMQFLNFLSRPEIQAAFAAETYYAPTNPDAIKLMTPAQAQFMSTKPEYLAVGFQPDADWLGKNIASIERQFIAWLAAG